MAVFSTNSVRHLYVANAATGATPGCFNEAKVTTDQELYLTFVNTESKVVKTDLIPLSKIKKLSTTSYVPRKLRKDTITFATPVVGQTYTLRILFRQWGSGSSENQYFKYVGSYKAKTGDTQQTLVDAFIASATVNFAREPVQLLTFSKNGSGTIATLSITEVAQPFVRGKQQGCPLDYTIHFVKITDAGGYENTEWGTVASNDKPNPGVGTANLAADMEYFYLGERGDQYRNVGYPYTFDTTYLVDTTKVYDIIDITYNSGDYDAIGAANAEKVLTVLCIAGTVAVPSHTVGNLIIADIETATGLTIADFA